MNKKLQIKVKVALRKSVKHWQKDIIDRLDNGEKIYNNGYDVLWSKNNDEVKCTSRDCALCTLYSYMCDMCPYTIYYRKPCEYKHWLSFCEKPSKRTAKAMRNALQRILNNWEKFVKKYDNLCN